MQELQSFVLQRVLWTRSVPGSALPSFSDFANAFLWFFSFGSWSQIVAGFRSAEAHLLFWIAGLLATLLLFLFRSPLRQRIEKSDLSHTNPRRIRTLFFNIFLSLLWSAPGPLTIAYVGWMIGQVGGDVDLGRAIAAGAGHAGTISLRDASDQEGSSRRRGRRPPHGLVAGSAGTSGLGRQETHAGLHSPLLRFLRTG